MLSSVQSCRLADGSTSRPASGRRAHMRRVHQGRLVGTARSADTGRLARVAGGRSKWLSSEIDEWIASLPRRADVDRYSVIA
jgi:hypothetical protein